MCTTTNLLLVLLVQAVLSFNPFTSDRLVLTKSSRFRPMVALSGDQLIYAIFPKAQESTIRFEYEKISDNRCEVTIDAKHDIQVPLYFDCLAKGHAILSFLGKNSSMGKYLVNAIVNLEWCTHATVVTPVNDMIIGKDDIVVLTGEDTFDVFLTRHRNCSDGKACRLRFGLDGTSKGWTDLGRIDDTIGWTINSVGEKNFSKGYFYTVFARNATIVQRLDKDLKVEREIEFGTSAYLHSNHQGHVSLCHPISAHDLSCDFLDENLERRAKSTIVHTESYRYYIRGARMFNLVDGSALLLFVLQVDARVSVLPKFSAYVSGIDAYGQVTNMIKFEDELCRDFDDINIVKMMNQFYCINVSCHESVRTKCIDFG